MEVLLSAQRRDTKGSRPTRRLRRTGKVPAVVYGHGLEGLTVTIDGRELHTALHTEAGANVLITLQIDGEKHLTLPRAIQRHPFRDEILHLDLYKISLKEKVRAEVGLELTGLPVGVKDGGGIVETMHPVLHIEALPTDIPGHITVDISGLEVGDLLRLGDLPEVPGVAYLDDPDTPLVTIALPAAALVPEAEAAAAEEEAPTAEEAP